MAEYQNIFTQVQVQGPVEWGMDNENNMKEERIGKPFFSQLVGWIGNAQIGPVFLGWTGMISLATGLLWFNIVGLNMLAQVGWSIPEFLRQLFWLALEPPGHGQPRPVRRSPISLTRAAAADRCAAQEGSSEKPQQCVIKREPNGSTYGDFPMTKIVKLASLSAAALLSASMLGGCASDKTARDMAQQALDAARGAQACCDANTERLDRMYQKIMSK
jgi:hypothetical protein